MKKSKILRRIINEKRQTIGKDKQGKKQGIRKNNQ